MRSVAVPGPSPDWAGWCLAVLLVSLAAGMRLLVVLSASAFSLSLATPVWLLAALFHVLSVLSSSLATPLWLLCSPRLLLRVALLSPLLHAGDAVRRGGVVRGLCSPWQGFAHSLQVFARLISFMARFLQLHL